MSMIFTILVVAWVIYMIVKKQYPQSILIIAGLLLLSWSVFVNGATILAPKATTNSTMLDIVHTFTSGMMGRVGGLGLIIMSIAGFSKYMDYLGASKALFAVVAAPIKKVKSPYLLLVLTFYISQFLVVFIPSHAGLALLMMVSMYPILIRAGVSKMSALGVIGCAQYMDVGPGSGNAILAANTAHLEVAVYFVKYQLPVFATTTIVLGIVHYFVQKYWDKKEGYVAEDINLDPQNEENMPPKSFAILPIVPMIFILGCSSLFNSKIKMNVVTAMFLSTFISMIFQFCRTRDVRETLGSLKYMFEGMGNSFATVIALIVSGEFFAAGLVKIGAVDSVIKSVQNIGLGSYAIIIVFSLVIAGCAFLMGSGNAAFFSFAALTPKIATSMGISVVNVMVPMQIMTSFGRVCSPIAGAIIAIAGLTNVSPVQIVKRTCIPMLVAAIINIIFLFARF